MQRRRRTPKLAAAVVAPVKVPEPVKAPEPQEPRSAGAQRERYKHGSWVDTVRIDSGTSKRISDCVERVFGDAPRIGHERQDAAA